MSAAAELIVAVRNLDTPAPRSKVAVPGICWEPVTSTSRLKG
jgi:hypothetical protein